MTQIEPIHTYLTTSPESQFLGRDVRVTTQWEGSDNLLWRVEHEGGVAVIKMFLDAGQVRSRRQFAGHETFSRLGLAPRLLWVDQIPEGLPRPVMVYEWAPGEMPAGDNAGQMYALATTVAQVHNSDPGALTRFCPHPANLDYFQRLLSASITQIDGWLAAYDVTTIQVAFARLAGNAMTLINRALPLWSNARPTPVHGDIKLANAIADFGSVTQLLDWEMFGLGDPALDVATFLHWSQHELDDAMQLLWLAAYIKLSEQPDIYERINVYRKLLPFQSVCYLLSGLGAIAKAGEMPGDDDAPARAFLQETLLVSWRQAASRLGAGSSLGEKDVNALFGKLSIEHR